MKDPTSSAAFSGSSTETHQDRAKQRLEADTAVNIRLLQCLQVLVTESHVTKAADRLGMSQPKLSNMLARLRRITGDPLLVRTPAGMLPTETARVLAAHASEFLLRWNSVVGSHRPFSPETTEHTFRVEATDSLVQELIVPVTHELRMIAPKVAISINTPSRSTMLEDLETGELDLVIGFIPQVPEDLFISQLWSYESCCIAAANHPRIRGSLTFDDFIREAHVVPTFGRSNEPSLTERFVNGLLAERDTRRCVSVFVPSILRVPDFVAKSDLLGLVPKVVAEQAALRLDLQIHHPPFALPRQDIVMIWHARTKNDPRHQWLRKVFRDVAQSIRTGS